MKLRIGYRALGEGVQGQATITNAGNPGFSLKSAEEEGIDADGFSVI